MDSLSFSLLAWAGILFCITQSAMFSGLNLALLGISRLRLEIEAQSGNAKAQKLLELRADSNLLLTTILWGNVGINVLLTLLSNSVMTGLVAFLFSTVLITFAGEILPQAYFSRNAIRMGALLAPVLRLYILLIYPVAKPSALVLDYWLGKEGINYFRERDFHTMIHKHIEAEHSDLGKTEGTGAINFMKLDDIAVSAEGERIVANSIITLPQSGGRPVFPAITRDPEDDFLRRVGQTDRKWIIIVDTDDQPYIALNANRFLRDALFSSGDFNPYLYCHHPIIVRNQRIQLGELLPRFEAKGRHDADDIIENDLILVWDEEKRVITGTDILGRLLRGIAARADHLPDPA